MNRLSEKRKGNYKKYTIKTREGRKRMEDRKKLLQIRY